MRQILRAGCLALLLLCAAAAAAEARADVKIKSRQTMQGQSYENATYIKGKRQRTESMGGQSVTIQQCDLRRDIQIMPAMRAYTVNPYGDASAAANAPAAAALQTVEQTKGGLVTSTVTTRDTGERKAMFGYTARRIITTIETKSAPDACTPIDNRMETDGWYIDAAFALDCDLERAAGYQNRQQAGGCRDRYQMKTVGSARRGYPVYEKIRMFEKDGRESFSMVNEVVELSQATLDASLFEPPADYREVKDFSAAAVMASAGSDDMNTGGAGSGQPSSNSGIGASVKSLAGSQSQHAPAEVGAKKPGVVRLGLAAVKTGAVGEGLSAADLAAAVRNTLAEYLKSPAVELVQLEAKLPSQVEAEARQKECDFVVYATVSHKKGGGGGFGGMFGKVVAPAIGQAGYGHTGSTAGNIAASTATTAVISAGTVSANVKQKDELTLEVKVQAPGADAPAAAKQFKSKAKSAGEDIISPAVEQAAELILTASVRS
ncbi:MAG: DUF4412 domain-containing protein [Acidobacteria bacterium]|nr:DUF4412 domain-containing protein [Acidobacteriota bacterium]